VIIGLRSPLTSGTVVSGTTSSSTGVTVDENACCARSLALVLVATESDIRRFIGGRTGGFGPVLENVCDRRSCNLGRRG
jgi:hypothetical protein